MTVEWNRTVTEVVWESQTAPGITWTTVVGGTSSGGGVTVHNDLSGRSAADAHPMSAITDLEPALTDIATAVQAQQGDIGTLQTAVAGKQASDADLTAIAALAPSDDALIQRKAGAWTSRTPAQVKADMSIGVGDVSGLDENTRDVIGTALVAGSGVAVTVDDPGNTITIAVSGVVADAINDGTTTVAPSQNAVYDALALKVPTSRTLAGLDLSADRTASTLRTALSLVPGTDVQAYDADLGQIAAATFADDDFVQKKAGSLTNRTIAQVKADLGGVATDAIFDAKGDLPVGTGADAAAKLTVGADGSSLTADSSAAAGVAWLGAVSIKAPKTADGGIHTPETTLAGGAAPQSAANAQVATWFPCWVHKPVRPLLRSYCFTLEAGSSARFALWTLDHATIRPGTLIEDLGLMAGTSTGAKALSASTATVTGWFFLAVWASNHTTVRWGRPTFDSSKCQMFGTMAVAWGRNQYGWRAYGLDYSSAWNSTLPTLEAASDIDHQNPILPYWEYT